MCLCARTLWSSCGEGNAARMAEAMSGLTLFSCWICLLHTCRRPFPPLSTRCPPAHSLSRWKEKPVCSLSRLVHMHRERDGGRGRGREREGQLHCSTGLSWSRSEATRLLEGCLCNRFGHHGDVVAEVLPFGQEVDGDAGVELQMHQRLRSRGRREVQRG